MGSEACALKGCPSSYAIELRLLFVAGRRFALRVFCAIVNTDVQFTKIYTEGSFEIYSVKYE